MAGRHRDKIPPPIVPATSTSHHRQQGFIIHKYSFHNATLRVSVSDMWKPFVPTLAGEEDTGLAPYPTFHLQLMVTCFLFLNEKGNTNVE